MGDTKSMKCTCGTHWLSNPKMHAGDYGQSAFSTSNGACYVVCLNCGSIYHWIEVYPRIVWKVDLWKEWNGVRRVEGRDGDKT
jgi:hypothetical protein